MRLSLSIPIIVVSLSLGCVVDTRVEGDVQLTCTGSAECPEGRTCVEGFCLSPDQLAKEPVAFIEAPVFDGAGTEEDESVRSDKAGKDAFHVVFTLNQEVPVDGIEAVFDGERLECVAAAARYRCAGSVSDATAPGVRPITVVARDAVGRKAEESVLLTVDKDAPQLTLLDVAIIRDGTPRDHAGDGAAVALTFVFDEPPASVQVAGSAPGNEPFALQIDGVLVTATLDVDQVGVDPGVRGVRVTAADRVDNEIAVELPEVFVVDFDAPQAPDVDTPDLVVYRRAPWGVDGGAPEQRLSGGAGAVEADALVAVSADAEGLQSLVFLPAASDGSFDATLPIGDLSSIFVRAVDAAGNASAVVRVRDGVWTPTPARPPGAPANPFLIDATPRLGRALIDDHMTAVDAASALASADTETLLGETRGTWRPRLFTSSPPARRAAAIAYDVGRDQAVLFGGAAASGSLLDDTWTFDGERWRLQTPARAPAPRRGAAMAYDPTSGLVVLFGGQGAAGLLDDTWLWDGVTWTPVAAAGPAATSDAAMASHPGGGALLFGGQDDGVASDEAWRFDGRARAWSVIDAPGPPARFSAAMAFVPGTGADARTILFGGDSGIDGGNAPLGDTWAFDGAAWSQIPAAGPDAQSGAALAFDPARGALVLVGSDASGSQTRSFVFSGSTWQAFSPPTLPPVRRDAALAAAGGRLVLFAGLGLATAVLEDTFVLHEDFLRLDTDEPPAFLAPVAAFDAASGRTIVVGSSGGRRTWAFDGIAWRELHVDGGSVGALAVQADASVVQIKPDSTFEVLGPAGWSSGGGVSPTLALGGSAAAFDGQHIVAVGPTSIGLLTPNGLGGSGWQAILDPGPRGSAAVSFTGAGVVLFGGAGCGARCGDTWVFDGAAWTDVTGTVGAVAPEPRSQHALAYDSDRDEVVLFGGSGGNGHVADTWVFRAGTWRRLLPGEAPLARAGHAMVADEDDHRVLLFGGTVGITATRELWEWRGGGGDRAAHVVRVPFSSAGVPDAVVNGIEVSVVAGARGRPSDVEQLGAVLLVWDGLAGGWRPVSGNDASPLAPATLSASFDTVAGARALVGADGILHLAIAPEVESGILRDEQAGEVGTDSVRVDFRYRLPASLPDP